MVRHLTRKEARRQLLKFIDEAKKTEGKGPSAVMINLERHRQLAELARLSNDPELLALIGPAETQPRAHRIERLRRRFITLARFSGVFKTRRA